MKNILTLILFFVTISSYAGTPVWTFTPLTPTTASVPANASATIKYIVTNQSNKTHTLNMKPISGVVQVTIGTGVCGNSFTLQANQSCTLSLQAIGSEFNKPVNGGPIVCQQGSSLECYQPSAANVLHLTPGPAIPLPSNCVTTADNNIQCQITINAQTNFGFTNMTYALCRSAQCDYDGVQTSVTCNCDLIKSYQGVYSASVAPNDYNSSKPVGNTVVSTYSMVNSSGETPTTCPAGPFANCFGATCTVVGDSVTCNCPVAISAFIAPQNQCNLGNKIWSATSTTSFPSIEGSMLFMYNTFFGGNIPK